MGQGVVDYTMKLPIVHQTNYVSALPENHRFPMKKFRLVYEYLRNRDPSNRFQFVEADPVSEETLLAVHGEDYIRRFKQGELSPEHQRKIGLPWSEGLVTRTFTAVGGTVRTAQLALEHGLACNTAGGTHHAFQGEGAGFCILNDLAVAARYLVDRAGLNKVLIVDADVHQGNGTAEIFQNSTRVITYSIHCSENYPFTFSQSHFDVSCPEHTENNLYLRRLRRTLSEVIEEVCPEFVLYDAGVDVHEQDQLGRLKLNDEGIRQRDQFVIRQATRRRIPIAAVIGGGYDEDVESLARRHTLLHKTALETLPREADPTERQFS